MRSFMMCSVIERRVKKSYTKCSGAETRFLMDLSE